MLLLCTDANQDDDMFREGSLNEIILLRERSEVVCSSCNLTFKDVSQ